MRRSRYVARLVGLLLVMAGLAWGVSEGVGGRAATVVEEPSRGLPRVSARARAAEVLRAVLGAAPGATIGVEVYDRHNGKSVVASGIDRPFPSASLVKLLIAMDAVSPAPAPGVASQVQDMLSRSDDNVADALWDTNGGPEIVTRVATRIGLHETRPPADPERWGETTTTARDLVTTYRYITDRLPGPQRGLIVGALSGATPEAADGSNQFFGIPDGLPEFPRAIKQGWMTDGETTVLHTTGLVGRHNRYVVVLLTATPDATATDQARAVTDGAAALAGAVTD